MNSVKSKLHNLVTNCLNSCDIVMAYETDYMTILDLVYKLPNDDNVYKIKDDMKEDLDDDPFYMVKEILNDIEYITSK